MVCKVTRLLLQTTPHITLYGYVKCWHRLLVSVPIGYTLSSTTTVTVSPEALPLVGTAPSKRIQVWLAYCDICSVYTRSGMFQTINYSFFHSNKLLIQLSNLLLCTCGQFSMYTITYV